MSGGIDMDAMVNGKLVTLDTQQQTEIQNVWAAQPYTPPPEEQRKTAVMTRTAFCQQLWRAGVMTQAEAEAAARGEWPASFAAFASNLTADESTDAKIEWAGATEIRYMAPLLQSLALSYAGDDQAAATAILDQIFGIS